MRGMGIVLAILVGLFVQPSNSYECSNGRIPNENRRGLRLGPAHLDADLTSVQAAFGEGQPGLKTGNIYSVEDRARGIDVSFNTRNDKVKAVFFYNHEQDSERFGVFCGQTDKGINWRSTVCDVKRLYGSPAQSFSVEPQKDWCSQASISVSNTASSSGSASLLHLSRILMPYDSQPQTVTGSEDDPNGTTRDTR